MGFRTGENVDILMTVFYCRAILFALLLLILCYIEAISRERVPQFAAQFTQLYKLEDL